MKRRHAPRGITIGGERDGETFSQWIARILDKDYRRWPGAARVKTEYHRRRR